MKIYLDTGVFLDYLIFRGYSGTFLRTAERRGRSREQLSKDATDCLLKLSSKNKGFTSSLTLYEVETSIYEKLQNLSKGLLDKQRYSIISARSLTTQILVMIEYHNIEVIELTQNTFIKVVGELELQTKAISAGDSIHIITAIMNNADVIISTDQHILDLNELFLNASGARIKCLDTDNALLLL